MCVNPCHWVACLPLLIYLLPFRTKQYTSTLFPLTFLRFWFTWNSVLWQIWVVYMSASNDWFSADIYYCPWLPALRMQLDGDSRVISLETVSCTPYLYRTPCLTGPSWHSLVTDPDTCTLWQQMSGWVETVWDVRISFSTPWTTRYHKVPVFHQSERWCGVF